MWQFKLLAIGIVLFLIGQFVALFAPLKTVGLAIIIIALVFSFVRAATVQEGTVKIIMRFGGVVKVFLQWEKYELTTEGKVMPSRKKNPWYGGLRIWMGTPWDRVYEYHLRFHTVEEKEGKRIPVFRDIPRAKSVQVRPDRYLRLITRMETKDGQFPDVQWQVGMRSINPEKTIFKSPHNWVENALNELEPSLRTFVRTHDLSPFLDLKRTEIWDVMKEDYAVKTVLRDEWGIQIDDNEIAIFDVTLPSGYQEALAAKSRAEMEAEAARRKMEIEAQARAAETVGTVIEMMAKARGKKVEEIQSEIETKPRLRKEFQRLANDLIVRKMGIEGAAYVDIRVAGPPGVEGKMEGQGFFSGLIDKFAEAMIKIEAAKQKIPTGKRSQEEKESLSKKNKEEEKKDLFH